MKPVWSPLALMAGIVLSFASVAQVSADTPAHAYVGAEKCAKTCHNDEKTGAQYDKWLAAKHSKAFATLSGEEAKKLGAAKGVTDPAKDDKCLKCHVTGHGVAKELLTETWKQEEGVTCESCHGPGSDFKKLSVMKDPAKAKEAGLLIPTEETCKKCHNPESPSYKPFDFKEFSAKIDHHNPEKKAAK